MNTKDHWEGVYTTKACTGVSWYQPHARTSLRFINEASLRQTDAILDVGGGASTLVDDLLGQGFTNLAVLDISAAALAAARARLGARAEQVRWIESNIVEARFEPHSIDFWHDRAVFHFLTNPEERAAYVQKLTHSLKPGGLLLVATFADDGPTRCSGLPVARYSPEQLQAEFSPGFELVRTERETHLTPSGAEQKFVYGLFRKTAN